jgi:hypothetical protein
MKKQKRRSKVQIRRARRRLVARAFPRLQLSLFEDNREATAQALAELRAALDAAQRELEELEERRSA